MSQQQQFISVTAMAQKLNLSRARFYQLITSGVFPQPRYYKRHRNGSRRPYFDAEQQSICLRARQTQIGANGEVVLFNRKRTPMKQEDLIEVAADLQVEVEVEVEVDDFPKSEEMTRPILDILAGEGQEEPKLWTVGDLYDAVSEHFELTKRQRQMLLPSKTKSLLEYRVQWAKSDLVAAGLASIPLRGRVNITCRGRGIAKDTSGPLTRAVLKQKFPSFANYLKPNKKKEVAYSESANMMGHVAFSILSRLKEDPFPHGNPAICGWFRQDIINAGICSASHQVVISVKNPKYTAGVCLTLLKSLDYVVIQKCSEIPKLSVCMISNKGREFLEQNRDADECVKFFADVWRKFRKDKKNKNPTEKKPTADLDESEMAKLAALMEPSVLLQYFVPNLPKETSAILRAKLLQGVY